MSQKSLARFRQMLAGILSEADYRLTNGGITTVDDERKAGVALSVACDWDGTAIMRVCGYALEDANFHTESEQMFKMSQKNGGGGYGKQ